MLPCCCDASRPQSCLHAAHGVSSVAADTSRPRRSLSLAVVSCYFLLVGGRGKKPSNVYFSSPLAPIGWTLPTLQTCQSSIFRGRQAHSPGFFLVVFFLAGGTERDCGLAQLRSGGVGGEYFETREWMSAEERRMWSVNSPCRRDKQRQPSPERERADTLAFLNFL